MPVRDLWRGGLVAVTMTASALPARAAEGMRWHQRGGEKDVVLAYEVRQQAVPLRHDDDAHRLSAGQRTTVEFASEGGRLSLPMRAGPQEMDSLVWLVGKAPLTPALASFLERRTLRITRAGETRRIPLGTAQPGVAALVRICGVR